MRAVSFPQFSNSKVEPFAITNPHTPTYNYIAWAFGDNTKWYWTDPESTYYWPDSIPREITVKVFIQLFNLIN